MSGYRPPPLLTLVHACAALFAAGSLAVTLHQGLEERRVALAFGVLVAMGVASLGRGIVLRRRLRGLVATGGQCEGKQDGAQQGFELHGVSPDALDAGAATTKGWPVRR